MQTIASRTSVRLAPAKRLAAVAPARVLNVRCQASLKANVAKIASAAAALPVMLAASPAFALVDERMNGDGVGFPLGVNNGALGWAMFGVFATLWIVWFISQRELGDFEDKDSGLKL